MWDLSKLVKEHTVHKAAVRTGKGNQRMSAWLEGDMLGTLWLGAAQASRRVPAQPMARAVCWAPHLAAGIPWLRSDLRAVTWGAITAASHPDAFARTQELLLAFV